MMLNMLDTSIAIQSRDTGRFLLNKNSNQWGFALWEYMDGFSPLKDMIDKMKVVLDKPDADELMFTYIMTKQATFHFYHVWTDGEPLSKYPAGHYEWRALFDFPADLHYTVDWAVESNHFMETILKPI